MSKATSKKEFEEAWEEHVKNLNYLCSSLTAEQVIKLRRIQTELRELYTEAAERNFP